MEFPKTLLYRGDITETIQRWPGMAGIGVRGYCLSAKSNMAEPDESVFLKEVWEE